MSRNILKVSAMIIVALLSISGFQMVSQAQDNATEEPTVEATVSATEAPMAQETATDVPPPTLSAYPKVRTQVYIAQEDFEHGYMFWISTQRAIFVLIISADNPNFGTWSIYPDTYQDSEPEFDPKLVPPSENLLQPQRGFGKLWRTVPGLSQALGWATTPEFDLTTAYVYQPGGYFDAAGNFVPTPGQHFITNLTHQTFMLTETRMGSGQWELVN
jgi:hypothetical protein